MREGGVMQWSDWYSIGAAISGFFIGYLLIGVTMIGVSAKEVTVPSNLCSAEEFRGRMIIMVSSRWVVWPVAQEQCAPWLQPRREDLWNRSGYDFGERFRWININLRYLPYW